MRISFNWHKKDKSKPFGFLMEECLSKDEADKLKSLDFIKLADMSTAERLDVLSVVVGNDRVEWLNSRIEKDLILKNQKQNLMNWVDNEHDIEPKWRKEIIRKISELEKPLNEKELDIFIEELVNLKLGIGVTLEEAQIITDLCAKADKAKKEMENGGSKADYEIAHKNIEDYMEMLKNS